MNQIPNIEEMKSIFYLLRCIEELTSPLGEALPDGQRLTRIIKLARLLEPAHHHQLQKAREEERERAVEIIKDELRTAPLEVQMTKGIVFANIIKRIQAELNQPNK